jgi:hypothetical protein
VSGSPTEKKVSTHTMNNELNGSKQMYLMHEDLARAQMSARLGEAQQLRRGHQVAQVRRLGRKAERAALQARLAVARAL